MGDVKGLSETFGFKNGDDDLKDKINETELITENGTYSIRSEWVGVREIPESENWFENVWSDFREKKVFK